MSLFEKIIFALQKTMPTPKPFGWFHLLMLGIMFGAILFLAIIKQNHSEKQLKIVLGVYGIVALILELLKQIVWSFNYGPVFNVVTWDYQWYAAPFQLCTTPMYVCLIMLFMKKCKLRDMLASYVAFTTILGSIATIFIPDSCFVDTILVNVHTTWLHYGSFVVSIYLIITGETKSSFKHLLYALIMFVGFTVTAMALNIIVYNAGVLNGETFNMFYISPYFISELPVFDIIQKKVPYIVFILTYIAALSLGSTIIWLCARTIQRLLKSRLLHRNKCFNHT